MQVVIYLSKPKQSDLVAALKEGFQATGDQVSVLPSTDFTGEPDKNAQMVCLVGYKNREIARVHHRAGRHVLLVDEAYIDPRRYHRLAMDEWQSPWMHHTDYELERLLNILAVAGIQLQPFKDPADKLKTVTYAGINKTFADWHGLANPVDFDRNQMRVVTAHAMDRLKTMHYHCQIARTKGILQSHRTAIEINSKPLEECLEESHALITWGQAAAVTAIIMGVPVVDTSKREVSPLHPFVETDPLKAFNPRQMDEITRLRALARIAHHQFTLDEIRTGFALTQLSSRTITRLKGLDPDSAEYVIEQYKIMHEQSKRYRGKLAVDFVIKIGELVNKHKAETLLDYGSGKGLQYSQMKQHDRWGITPTCYDPGYPPLANKPEGKFDGVICTDVAEHVPPAGIEDFLRDVIGYANKFVFFCIFTDYAVKTLPDGRNAHLTVKPATWWNQRIVEALKVASPETLGHIEQLNEDTYVITSPVHEIVVFYRHSNAGKK